MDDMLTSWWYFSLVISNTKALLHARISTALNVGVAMRLLFYVRCLEIEIDRYLCLCAALYRPTGKIPTQWNLSINCHCSCSSNARIWLLRLKAPSPPLPTLCVQIVPMLAKSLVALFRTRKCMALLPKIILLNVNRIHECELRFD